ncbi:hypothetical protein U1Q18_004768 [Sarracenia purpurea var. burkii]
MTLFSSFWGVPEQQKGKERIEMILEKLEAEGCGMAENFETFSRVSIRRLGRLLPEARWEICSPPWSGGGWEWCVKRWLPFMEPRQKKGQRGLTLKRCLPRVKCFIEVELRVYRDGKQVTLLQLEKQYQEWIFQMHDRYDEEIDRGEDQPLLLVSPSNKEGLGISSEVARVHKEIQRKGSSWKSGQKIKILKGACAGYHKNNCLPVETAEWEHQVEKQRQKMASTIEILSARHCQDLEIDGALPTESAVYAGHIPPKNIVAVVRPASFNSASASGNLDQKYILISKDNLEIVIQIKFRSGDKSVKDACHIYSGYIESSSLKGFQGLYIFPLGCKFPDLFQKAGSYTFLLSLRGSSCVSCERTIKVKASFEVGKHELLCDGQSRCNADSVK